MAFREMTDELDSAPRSLARGFKQGDRPVKYLSKIGLLAAGLALLTSALPAPARAQAAKPVAILSLASIRESLNDAGYLTRAAGMEDAGKTSLIIASGLVSGIDKTRPLGMYVLPKGDNFHGIAFLPITDLKMLLEIHKEYLGTPKDVGDGILEIGTG